MVSGNEQGQIQHFQKNNKTSFANNLQFPEMNRVKLNTFKKITTYLCHKFMISGIEQGQIQHSDKKRTTHLLPSISSFQKCQESNSTLKILVKSLQGSTSFVQKDHYAREHSFMQGIFVVKGTLLCQIIEAVKAWLSNIICKLTQFQS